MADRRRPGPSPRIVAVWIVVPIVVLAVVLGSIPTARSQTTDTLPDGTYSGGIYLRAHTYFEPLGGGTGTLDTHINTAGEATLTILSESISGDWTLEGTGVIDGTFTLRGVTSEASGNTVITGSGVFSGTPSAGRLSGTSTTTGQWTMGAGTGGGFTSPIDNTGPFDEPLTDLLKECSQLLGRWDSELRANWEGLGLTVTGLAAYLVLSDGSLLAEEGWMADRLRDLGNRANSVLGDARAGGDVLVAIKEGAKILSDVETLQADISAVELDCPANKAFQNILTLIAQDALDTILTGFETDPDLTASADTLRTMIRLGNGTGAIGSGAKDTGQAADLEARMEAHANEAFNDALDSYVEGGGDEALNEAVALAALGEQQGWNLATPVGITGEDVLDVTGN